MLYHYFKVLSEFTKVNTLMTTTKYDCSWQGALINTSYWTPGVICQTCGDGIIHPTLEQCDDFNTIQTDGCENCIDVVSKCYTDEYGKSVCLCGNGVLDSTNTLANE